MKMLSDTQLFTPIDRYIKNHQTEPYPAAPEQPIHVVANVTDHKLIERNDTVLERLCHQIHT